MSGRCVAFLLSIPRDDSRSIPPLSVSLGRKLHHRALRPPTTQRPRVQRLGQHLDDLRSVLTSVHG